MACVFLSVYTYILYIMFVFIFLRFAEIETFINGNELSVTPNILIFFSRLKNRLEECPNKTSLTSILYVIDGHFKFKS